MNELLNCNEKNLFEDVKRKVGARRAPQGTRNQNRHRHNIEKQNKTHARAAHPKNTRTRMHFYPKKQNKPRRTPRRHTQAHTRAFRSGKRNNTHARAAAARRRGRASSRPRVVAAARRTRMHFCPKTKQTHTRAPRAPKTHTHTHTCMHLYPKNYTNTHTHAPHAPKTHTHTRAPLYPKP